MTQPDSAASGAVEKPGPCAPFVTSDGMRLCLYDPRTKEVTVCAYLDSPASAEAWGAALERTRNAAGVMNAHVAALELAAWCGGDTFGVVGGLMFFGAYLADAVPSLPRKWNLPRLAEWQAQAKGWRYAESIT